MSKNMDFVEDAYIYMLVNKLDLHNSIADT